MHNKYIQWSPGFRKNMGLKHFRLIEIILEFLSDRKIFTIVFRVKEAWSKHQWIGFSWSRNNYSNQYKKSLMKANSEECNISAFLFFMYALYILYEIPLSMAYLRVWTLQHSELHILSWISIFFNAYEMYLKYWRQFFC